MPDPSAMELALEEMTSEPAEESDSGMNSAEEAALRAFELAKDPKQKLRAFKLLVKASRD